MSTHAAVIDDRDPLIQYAGSWTEVGAAEEFDSTRTCSVAAGVTATVPFVGTSITVYGTVAASNLTSQPIWSFAVDGSVMSTYTPHDNILALWTSRSSSIANGSHQLVVTQTRTPEWCQWGDLPGLDNVHYDVGVGRGLPHRRSRFTDKIHARMKTVRLGGRLSIAQINADWGDSWAPFERFSPHRGGGRRVFFLPTQDAGTATLQTIMSSANVNAAPYTGYSQYTTSGAGPPPALSHS
ncbi:hypothetical protein B0H14DRAFT_3745928 [Mycena olivaceomarginata]|nr:hypothetical protein B0H14DRAFT_3745928 [Mycena olivaceomarginata]